MIRDYFVEFGNKFLVSGIVCFLPDVYEIWEIIVVLNSYVSVNYINNINSFKS